MKKIVIACGTGICTSTMAADKLRKELKERKKDSNVTINQCKVAELVSKAADYDLIISTTQVPSKITTPVVSGLPFLTGVGISKVVDEVIEKLNL
ncbi:PTS sugar transporter subunit IIB [Sporanaerobacter sp. PP17-6a]|uniref:PTS sugar transporter subunit IIB n=1 Tax=Sporanaerobacter sp. PP17-6a TaxID=1891289 RepID=UPI0008A0147C|nr:PTS sugar transporter subunit IIB [Sporanaerobacter sp. PP17-6a]SCL89768.1 Galactitol-specific phosphotransferase enzyme IIB component [Sporanaerobacter sp. PP17-6a]